MAKIKVTFYLEEEVSKKLKKLSYVSGMTQLKLVDEALQLLFKTPKQVENLARRI